MFRKQKEKSMDQFLKKFGETYDKEIDPDGEKQNAAISYLKKSNLNPESLDDLSEAMDSLSKQSDRLISLQKDLMKQGEDPTSVPWINQEQYENTLCQQGILGLMMKLRNE